MFQLCDETVLTDVANHCDRITLCRGDNVPRELMDEGSLIFITRGTVQFRSIESRATIARRTTVGIARSRALSGASASAAATVSNGLPIGSDGGAVRAWARRFSNAGAMFAQRAITVKEGACFGMMGLRDHHKGTASYAVSHSVNNFVMFFFAS